MSKKESDSELTTVVFSSEPEYVRFVTEVHNRIGGRGLELTDVPITLSARLSNELLEGTQGYYGYHPVTDEEIAQVLEKAKDKKPWDPANLAGFRIPGLPFSSQES